MNNSISDLIKKYEKSRRPASAFGKSDHYDIDSITDFIKLLPAAGNRKVYTLDQLKHDLYFDNGLIGRFENE